MSDIVFEDGEYWLDAEECAERARVQELESATQSSPQGEAA